MHSWCQTSTLYKGLFTLVLALIALEYLFGSFIETRQGENLYTFNATRLQFSEKPSFQHHPIIKALLPGANTNTTIKSYNFTNNLTSVDTLGINFTTNFVNITNATTYFENLADITDPNKSNSTAIPLCPEVPPNLRGKIEINKFPVPSVLDLEKRFSWLKPGGHWFPETCKAIKKVAIIIPFRCRGEHLLIFLQHMHPLLRKQQLDYTILVVEQEGNGSFNRAMLMNIGFTEALKIHNFDCFIFHDVDLLPEDDRNLYTCPEQPRHMSVAVDIFKYKLPYAGIFGGVSAISREHFQLLNGFSNSFWGWGGEDDDMSNRIRFHKLHISRYPITIARYSMLHHKKDKPSPNRYDILKTGQKRFDTDGLSNLKYTVQNIKQNLLYTWLLVKLEPPS